MNSPSRNTTLIGHASQQSSSKPAAPGNLLGGLFSSLQRVTAGAGGNGGGLFGGILSKNKKAFTLEEAMARSKEVVVNDLFMQFKDLIGYLSTNIKDITDVNKDNQVLQTERDSNKSKGSIKALKNEGFSDKFGKLFLLGAAKPAPKNEETP